jgi:hypothetical protein
MSQQVPLLNSEELAQQYFQEDAKWYVDNVPFFECSDKEVEQVYYYRWKLYKAHIRSVGDNEYVVTEFINHVPWDREPYCTINASSMHHIYEGRWLHDKRYINGYIDNLYHGGNNRRYSESIADAAYARYLVNADSAFLISELDSMKQIYEGWYDHWDSSKDLYWIPAMPDATEYTIASVDASGGKDGFDDGEAFRPTLNSYMYGNAMAISKIAAMAGDNAASEKYLQRALDLKANVEQNLWNDPLKHFTDRFKVNNEFVHYWDFIRGRELAGMIPWYFNLPADNAKFGSAWEHVLDTNNLLGQYGLRTNEPSYEYYFKQFVYFEGKRGSQWNGPSWPYQTSQALTGLANLLNDYHQHTVTNSDYLKLLRLYTRQHFLPDGTINLVENYDPNNGGPIVYYYWSNHYNHSSYNNLVITGLCGIRPSNSDSLTINPLIDGTINYFCLQDVLYHGHRLTVVYDRDGEKYHIGKGLTVFVDGEKRALANNRVSIGRPINKPVVPNPHNAALNINKKGYPVPSASVNAVPDSLFQATDGRTWYFPEISNRWTTFGSTSSSDWYALDFGKPEEISSVNVSFFADDTTFFVPESIRVEYDNGSGWKNIPLQGNMELKGNTSNIILFDKVTATRLRLNFVHGPKAMALVELECY